MVNYGDVLLQAQGTAGYAISLLFLLFLVISIIWEVILGALAWLTSMWGASGLASQLWLSKLKEELLSLGVISLVLAFIKTRLAHICVPLPHPGGPASEASVKNFERVAGRLLASLAEVVPDPTDISPPSYQPEENQLDTAAKCPEGKQLLFTKDLITAAHYMLFYLAIVQIVYSVISTSFTLKRFLTLQAWEQAARAEPLDAFKLLPQLQEAELLARQQGLPHRPAQPPSTDLPAGGLGLGLARRCGCCCQALPRLAKQLNGRLWGSVTIPVFDRPGSHTRWR
ncbi:Mlo family-domain-containing protein [Haematococcus lacustris]